MTLGRGDIPAEAQARMIEVILSESERLAHLIDDVMLTSHIDAVQVQIGSEAYDPAALLRSVAASTSAAHDGHPNITLVGKDQAVSVVGDRAKVRQILANLIDNAIKYSPAGRPIEVGFRVDNARIRYWVSGQGIGIPKPDRLRIFEKYHRLDPNHARSVSGIGLGLYICQELALLMRGRIWVESNPAGPGSTFQVELPRQPELGASTTPAGEPGQTPVS